MIRPSCSGPGRWMTLLIESAAVEQQDAADEPWIEWRLAADLGVLRTQRRSSAGARGLGIAPPVPDSRPSRTISTRRTPTRLEGLTTRRHRIRPGVSRRLRPRAKRRATPPLSPNQRARPAARLALEHEARCARTVERHRDRLEARSCSGRDVRRQATATTWARMVAPCGCGA